MTETNGSEWDELNRLEQAAAGVLAAPRHIPRHSNRPAILRAAVTALRDAFVRLHGEEALVEEYCATVEDNLVPGIPLSELREAFDKGKGHELLGDEPHPRKMAALFSSSALVLNTFGPWMHTPTDLIVNGHTGYHHQKFEEPVSHGLPTTPPHLDLILESPDRVLAIESKCLKYLTPKHAVFRPAYHTIVDDRRHSPWYRHIAALKDSASHYAHLDAAQLIKHYLGLAHTERTRAVTLLYLFWEPTNWEDFAVFSWHREEIQAFSKIVAGDRVQFEAMSYLELWKEWEGKAQPDWLTQHLQQLRARYQVALP